MVQKVNPEKSSVQSKKNIKINSVKLYMKEQNSFSEKNVFFDIINNKKGQKKKEIYSSVTNSKWCPFSFQSNFK